MNMTYLVTFVPPPKKKKKKKENSVEVFVKKEDVLVNNTDSIFPWSISRKGL